MQLLNTVTALLALSTSQAAEQPKIVGASLFKNGYAVILREMPIRGSETLIKQIPAASLGTLWITAEGNTVTAVKNMQVKTPVTDTVDTFDEILQLNMGKTLTLVLAGPQEVTGVVKGADGNIVVMQVGSEQRIVAKGSIQSILSREGNLIFTRQTETVSRALQIKTSGTGGKLLMLSLEKGMTWAPSYMIDISDKSKLRIMSKAIILNDLADLNAVDLRLITGFPNLAFLGIPDPLTSGVSVDQFVNMLLSMGTMGRDQFANAPMATQAAGRGAMEMRADFFGGAPTNPDVSQSEDLTFYNLNDITLQAQDRGYYPLFQAESPYEHLYTWDIVDAFHLRQSGQPSPPADIWHTLKFTNSSKLAWTTGPVTITKDGEILGQDLIRYSPVGSEVVTRITKALDIKGEELEEEIGRERDNLKLRNGVTYDLVTIKCTLSLTNMKNEAVKVRTTKEVTGELVQSEGSPKVTKVAKGLRDVNPRTRLEFTDTVPAKGKLERTFTYKVYINP